MIVAPVTSGAASLTAGHELPANDSTFNVTADWNVSSVKSIRVSVADALGDNLALAERYLARFFDCLKLVYLLS